MQGEIRVESNYQTDAISNRISSVYQAGGSQYPLPINSENVSYTKIDHQRTASGNTEAPTLQGQKNESPQRQNQDYSNNLYDESPEQLSQDIKIGVKVKKKVDKKKWNEVLRFMKANPNIMLEVLPPTASERRKRIGSSDIYQSSHAFQKELQMSRQQQFMDRMNRNSGYSQQNQFNQRSRSRSNYSGSHQPFHHSPGSSMAQTGGLHHKISTQLNFDGQKLQGSPLNQQSDWNLKTDNHCSLAKLKQPSAADYPIGFVSSLHNVSRSNLNKTQVQFGRRLPNKRNTSLFSGDMLNESNLDNQDKIFETRSQAKTILRPSTTANRSIQNINSLGQAESNKKLQEDPSQPSQVKFQEEEQITEIPLSQNRSMQSAAPPQQQVLNFLSTRQSQPKLHNYLGLKHLKQARQSKSKCNFQKTQAAYNNSKLLSYINKTKKRPISQIDISANPQVSDYLVGMIQEQFMAGQITEAQMSNLMGNLDIYSTNNRLKKIGRIYSGSVRTLKAYQPLGANQVKRINQVKEAHQQYIDSQLNIEKQQSHQFEMKHEDAVNEGGRAETQLPEIQNKEQPHIVLSKSPDLGVQQQEQINILPQEPMGQRSKSQSNLISQMRQHAQQQARKFQPRARSGWSRPHMGHLISQKSEGQSLGTMIGQQKQLMDAAKFERSLKQNLSDDNQQNSTSSINLGHIDQVFRMKPLSQKSKESLIRKKPAGHWPRFADSSHLLSSAIYDIEKVNQRAVDTIEKSNSMYKASKLKDQVNSEYIKNFIQKQLERSHDLSMLDKNVQRKMEPKIVSFKDFQRLDSMKRLDPGMKYHKSAIDFNYSPHSSRSRKRSGQSRPESRKRTSTHARRLQKLQHIRKKLRSNGQSPDELPALAQKLKSKAVVKSKKRSRQRQQIQEQDQIRVDSASRNSKKSLELSPPSQEYKIVASKSLLEFGDQKIGRHKRAKSGHDDGKERLKLEPKIENIKIPLPLNHTPSGHLQSSNHHNRNNSGQNSSRNQLSARRNKSQDIKLSARRKQGNVGSLKMSEANINVSEFNNEDSHSRNRMNPSSKIKTDFRYMEDANRLSPEKVSLHKKPRLSTGKQRRHSKNQFMLDDVGQRSGTMSSSRKPPLSPKSQSQTPSSTKIRKPSVSQARKGSESVQSSMTDQTFQVDEAQMMSYQRDGQDSNVKPGLVKTQTGIWLSTDNPKDAFKHEKKYKKKKNKKQLSQSKRKRREKSAEVRPGKASSPAAMRKNNNTSSSNDIISNVQITHSFGTSQYCQCGQNKKSRSKSSESRVKEKAVSQKQSYFRKQSTRKVKRQQTKGHGFAEHEDKNFSYFQEENSSHFDSRDTSTIKPSVSPINPNFMIGSDIIQPPAEHHKETIEVKYNEEAKAINQDLEIQSQSSECKEENKEDLKEGGIDPNLLGRLNFDPEKMEGKDLLIQIQLQQTVLLQHLCQMQSQIQNQPPSHSIIMAQKQEPPKEVQDKEGTPKADAPMNLDQQDLFKSRIDHRQVIDGKVETALTTSAQAELRLDWSKTSLYHRCTMFRRFQRPPINDPKETKILTLITNLRKNPDQHQKAHLLMPMFEAGMDFLENVLSQEMGLNHLFMKIQRSYKEINYISTLKLLVRSKQSGQLRTDLTLVICKYLDFQQLLTNIEQLRDESSSDNLISMLIDQLQKEGLLFLQKSQKFCVDYRKILKDRNQLWLGNVDMIKDVTQTLEKFGYLQKNYKDLL